jgi:hypothetical protein
VKVHIRVQHAVGRNGALARLLEHLPPAVEVITDHEAQTKPNPFRGFLACFQDLPEEATHLVVLQDDCLPCRNFTELLEDAIAEKPDDVISLFVGGLPGNTRKLFLQALARGDRWSPVYFREIHHVVGLCWPIHHARHFVDFVANNKIPGPNPPKSDDAVVGYWARKNRNTVQVWATVPCLVQHDDEFPSVVQAANRFSDRGRTAIAFQDDLS